MASSATRPAPTPTRIVAPVAPSSAYGTGANPAWSAPRRAHVTDKSAVFAIGRPTADGDQAVVNPFGGTIAVTLPCGSDPVGLEVFAADAARMARCLDEATGKAVYLIGQVAHASLAGDALLRWIGRAAVDDPGALRDVVGAFTLLIDDRRARRVMFVPDAMGLRPWFVGSSAGRLVAGTHVLGICDAGLSAGRVDYDAVASWLCYNFVCTSGSVVSDYRRVDRGAVSTFHAAGGLLSRREYAPARFGTTPVPLDELVEAQHSNVSQAFEQLTRGVEEVNLPLSGGFDSRFMCALAVANGRPRVHATVVRTTAIEAELAQRTADALGLPLRVIPVNRSKVDLFDDPLYFLPEGFPTPRNLTNAVARLHPGMPVLSGYMGDMVMRGSLTAAGQAYGRLDDQGLGDDELAQKAHGACRVGQNKLHLLRDRIGPAATSRAVAALRNVIREGRASGRALAYTSLFMRQRLYFANIFQSHLDVADALLPLAAWNVVDFNQRHVTSFNAETYDRLFKRFYPKLAGIPQEFQHATKLGKCREIPLATRPTRHLRRWASELLRGVPGKWSSTAITPRKLLKRLPQALLAESNRADADAIGYLHRIHAFEERLHRANVSIDWSKL